MAVTKKVNARGATVKTRTKKNGTVVKKVTGPGGGVRKTKTRANGSTVKTNTNKSGKTTGRTTNKDGKVTSITTADGKTKKRGSVSVRIANKAKNGTGGNAKRLQALAAKKKVARKAGDTEKLASLRQKSMGVKKDMRSKIKARKAARQAEK
jgi:hypothetical protein